MSNEEKTKELADFLYFKLSHIDYGTLTKKFLEMAAWKEQQMIERITKLLKENCGDDWYIKRYSYDDAVLDRDELLKDIIQILKEE